MTEQRRTPDYDFFANNSPAGAPSGTFGAQTSQFGAGPQAQLQAQQLGTTPPQFGNQPPVHQFGTPPPQDIGPHNTRPAKKSGALRLVRVIAVPVGVTLVLAAFGLGRFAGLFDGEMRAPATLADVSMVTGPMAEVFEATAHEDLQGVSDEDATAAFYGERADSPNFVLVAARARMDVDYEFADGGFTGARSNFGDVVCAPSDDAQVSLCMRTERRLTVLVAAYGEADLAYLAGITDEAWETF